MRELPEDILDIYTVEELNELKNNILNYMVDFNSNDISWKALTRRQMQEFIMDNYFTNFNLVAWDNGAILGMHYLKYRLYSDKYFIGTIKNNINKETIVGCIGYNTDYEIIDNSNYIATVEINYFYQGNGLSKVMYDNFVKILDLNRDIVITGESFEGKKCHVIANLKKVLRKNDFKKEIYIDG